MRSLPQFVGVGVGPGASGLIPVLAVEALKSVDVIVVPRAKSAACSLARQCVADLALPDEKFQEVEFDMDCDRSSTRETYDRLARQIAGFVRGGKRVAYLTIGDSMTFSTYGYLLEALKREMPEILSETIPGITSYAAIASAAGWTLGQGKERILVLPCPETVDELLAALEANDLVVLMKIGARLKIVKEALSESAYQYVIAQKIGLAGELIENNLRDFEELGGGGYLTTMLIRKRREEGE